MLHHASLCLCGHAYHAHRDWRRATVEHCHTADCPCTGFNLADLHAFPAASLSDLLVGMHVTIEHILGTWTGCVSYVHRHGAPIHAVTVALISPGGAVSELTVRADMPITLSIHDDLDITP